MEIIFRGVIDIRISFGKAAKPKKVLKVVNCASVNHSYSTFNAFSNVRNSPLSTTINI